MDSTLGPIESQRVVGLFTFPLAVDTDKSASQLTTFPSPFFPQIAVVEETVEKLEFLGTITPNVLTQREELSKMVGDEISRLIEDQRTLEQRYENLIAQRSHLKA